MFHTFQQIIFLSLFYLFNGKADTCAHCRCTVLTAHTFTVASMSNKQRHLIPRTPTVRDSKEPPTNMPWPRIMLSSACWIVLDGGGKPLLPPVRYWFVPENRATGDATGSGRWNKLANKDILVRAYSASTASSSGVTFTSPCQIRLPNLPF